MSTDMDFRWYDYMAFTNPPFFTVMAIMLLASHNVAAGIVGLVFLVASIWWWLVWGAILANYYMRKEEEERRRRREMRKEMRGFPRCQTFCHNSGQPMPGGEEE